MIYCDSDTACPVAMLMRGYSDARIAARSRLTLVEVEALRRFCFTEQTTPRSGAMEQGVCTRADARLTHAAAEGG